MTEIFDRSVTKAAAQRFFGHKKSPVAELEQARDLGTGPLLDSLDEVPRYVNRFLQQGRHDLAAEFLEKRSLERADGPSALERVIQQNDLMSIAFFSRGLRAARAVCRIVIRDASGRFRGHGTGFMISSRLMMTNNHVLSSSAAASRSSIEFDFAIGPDGKSLPIKTFGLNPQLFFETHDRSQLDFTIVAVEAVNSEGDAVEERGWIYLIPQSGKAIAGEPLNIIQHPAGEHMQIAIRENEALGPDGDYFIYTTDTKRGSSGSPVLNDQWQVAALHHAGVPNKDQDGNWLRKDGGRFRDGVDDPTTIDWVANEGVRISRIVQNMSERHLSPTDRLLFEETLQPPPDILPREGEASPSATKPATTPVTGMEVGLDGVARWNFQLSFGPAGVPTATAVPSVATGGPPAPTVIVGNYASDRSAESVFQSRGDYFDEASDAVAVDQYYNNVADNLSKSARYNALSSLLKDTHDTILSYSVARHDHLYPWIDRREDETLKSIYSGAVMPEELFVAEVRAFEAAQEMLAAERGLESMALSEADRESIDLDLEASSAFNCEHVVPQSWFKGEAEARAQKSDLHHLFTCESGCNSFRSNIPYSEFSDEEEAKIKAQEVSLAEVLEDPSLEAVRPQCGLRDGRRFEPNAGKGALARATLYFVLRYPGVVGDIKTGSKKEFVKSNVEILLRWAEDEPVSRYERHRNAEIAKVQGNRNPLIDRPKWLRQIDFGKGFG